jgi:hypothetical protein
MEPTQREPTREQRIIQLRERVKVLEKELPLAKSAADAASHDLVIAGTDAGPRLQIFAADRARRYGELRDELAEGRRLLGLLEEQERFRQAQEDRFLLSENETRVK